MPLDWGPFVEFVAQHQRFLILTHVRPDGDAIGSQLALADALVRLGKVVDVVAPSVPPADLRALDTDSLVRASHDVAPGSLAGVQAAIVVDTGTWNQLAGAAELLRSLEVPRAVIDHHPTQDDLGALQMVDTSAEAAARLVYEATVALGLEPSPRAAELMFLGLATDTGWFRHPNVTPATFELAAALSRLGARPTSLHEALSERNTLSRYKLLSRAFERMQLAGGGRVAFTEVTREDITATGAASSDAFDLINYARGLQGVEAAFVLTEQADGSVKASFRARPGVNVGRVAEGFGGGGHRLASGATLPGPLADARQKVLAAVEAAVAAPE